MFKFGSDVAHNNPQIIVNGLIVSLSIEKPWNYKSSKRRPRIAWEDYNSHIDRFRATEPYNTEAYLKLN